MGGTGTAVTTQAKDKQLTKDFLAWAKCDREQSIKMWTILGFDPVRFDVWTDPAMKAPNKFTDYYGTGIFDMLYSIRDQFNPINFNSNYPQGVTVLQTQVIPVILQSKSKTPRQALKDAADQLRALK